MKQQTNEEIEKIIKETNYSIKHLLNKYNVPDLMADKIVFEVMKLNEKTAPIVRLSTIKEVEGGIKELEKSLWASHEDEGDQNSRDFNAGLDCAFHHVNKLRQVLASMKD